MKNLLKTAEDMARAGAELKTAVVQCARKYNVQMHELEQNLTAAALNEELKMATAKPKLTKAHHQSMAFLQHALDAVSIFLWSILKQAGVGKVQEAQGGATCE